MAAPMVAFEDSVRFKLFCTIPQDEGDVSQFYSKKMNDYKEKLLGRSRHYIWHVEPLRLEEIISATDTRPAHISGSLFYGENVEDEWFVAYLLLELTRDDCDLVVSLEDEDGDIFLIEAADYLPGWLTPEVGEGRVFLHRGAVHIVEVTSIDEQPPPLGAALHFIRSFPAKTIASCQIQDCIRRRVRDFEGEALSRTKLHRTHAFLPAQAAAILEHSPQLVSAASRAFYQRAGAVDEKCLETMRYFPPEVRYMRSVNMSRFLFARLRHERFSPDPKTGWQLPSPQDEAFVAYDLGAKLACGLELLACSANDQGHDSNPRFNHYIQRLKERGYFKDALENSSEYEKLLQQAREYFGLHPSNELPLVQVANVSQLLRELSVDHERYKREEPILPPAQDESWMHISENDLNSLLMQYLGPQAVNPILEASQAAAVPKRVGAFMRQRSDYEGVEVPSTTSKTSRIPADTMSELSDMFSGMLDFRIPSDDGDATSTDSSNEYGHESDREDQDEIIPDVAPNGMNMREYIDALEEQLLSEPAMHDLMKDSQPENMDMAVLENLLSACQLGGPSGAANTLLNSIGLYVPPNDDDHEDAVAAAADQSCSNDGDDDDDDSRSLENTTAAMCGDLKQKKVVTFQSSCPDEKEIEGGEITTVVANSQVSESSSTKAGDVSVTLKEDPTRPPRKHHTSTVGDVNGEADLNHVEKDVPVRPPRGRKNGSNCSSPVVSSSSSPACVRDSSAVRKGKKSKGDAPKATVDEDLSDF